MTMERVRKAITFNAKLKDESTWLWFALEQTGFPVRLGQATGGEHEEGAENSKSGQGVGGHCVSHYLSPATDFTLD